MTGRAHWLRMLAVLPAFLAIFGFGQAVLDRHAWRLDLTPERRYTLSPQAVGVLQSLTADVHLLAFQRSQDPRAPAVEDLLRQVAAVTPRVRVDTVDVNRSPALARQYGVDAYGALVVESAGRKRVFANPREETLIAAIRQVTEKTRRVVGWSVGHGEGDLGSPDRLVGYGAARAALNEGFFTVRSIALLDGEVPPDVGVLVIAGAQKDLLPQELAALDAYVRRGGALAVFLGPTALPRLDATLRTYGVAVTNDVVLEPKAKLYGGEGLTLQVQLDRVAHPLSAAMGAAPLFTRSRSVELVPNVDGTRLMFTTASGWATQDLTQAMAAEPRFVEGRDRQGPIGLGVEVYVAAGTDEDGNPRSAQVICYGNAEFAGNAFFDFLGNRDLLLNTISWLARDRHVLGEREARREHGVQQFFMSEEDGERAFWFAAVVQPGVFLVIGLALVARRWWG